MPDAVQAPPAQAARSRPRPHLPHVTLNSDGRAHPRENGLAIFALVAGLVTCVVGFIANQHGTGAWAHVVATWLGLITMAVGLPAQLWSQTREERIIIVAGLVAAFVGGALGLAHGGLFP
jgi:hypothetical protein